jgi:hypothetical protein
MADEQQHEHEQEHEYPEGFGPGKHWATDMAWNCVDVLRPGLLSMQARSLLVGAITVSLMQVKDSCMPEERKSTEV